MGKWLAAICKGLSVAAGPFGAFGEFALKLFEGKQAECANKLIQEMISENKNLSLEVLQILREIKKRDPVSGAQFANGASVIIELIRRQENKALFAEQLEDLIPSLIESHKPEFFENDFVSIPTLVEECCRCWGNMRQIRTFETLVTNLGFKSYDWTVQIQIGDQISDVIRQVLSPLYSSDQQVRIIGGLSDRAKGSDILRLAYQLLLLNKQGKRGHCAQ